MSDNSTATLSFHLSLAGIWQPVDSKYITASYSGTLANTFEGKLPLGPSGLDGFLITGWAFQSNFGGSEAIIPVKVAVFSQGQDGLMSLSTDQYISDPTTNGGGSVVVADFNGDGKSDIFLAAHNESPFQAAQSTVYLSTPAGTFTKLTLNDAVMAHDAELAKINGIPTIVTETFTPGDINPFYSWNGTGFTGLKVLPSTGAMDIAVADFDGDGHEEVVLGDFIGGPSVPFSPNNSRVIAVYPLTNDGLGSTPLQLLTPYFNGKPEYSNLKSGIGQAEPTHTYRVWVDDFNYDGKPDILGGESVWDATAGTQAVMLQMFQNAGNAQFKDVTDTLNSSFATQASGEIDYQMQMVDVDASGINTYFSGVTEFGNPGSNFVMVNDGTGRLYYAVHDEFVSWAQQLRSWVDTNVPNLADPVAESQTPQFIAYQTSSGLINFVAEIAVKADVDGSIQDEFIFVNVPTQIDLGTYVVTPMSITDRNGSHLIRTFAGDDTIYSGNDGGYCHIDGGLGTNTLVYSGGSANYSVIKNADNTFTVTDKVASDGVDTFVNMQVLKFADASIEPTQAAVEYVLQAVARNSVSADDISAGLETLSSGQTSLTYASQLAPTVKDTTSAILSIFEFMGATADSASLTSETNLISSFNDQFSTAAGWVAIGASLADSKFSPKFAANYGDLSTGAFISAVTQQAFGTVIDTPALQNEFAIYQDFFQHYADATDPTGNVRARGGFIADMLHQASDYAVLHPGSPVGDYERASEAFLVGLVEGTKQYGQSIFA